MHEIFRRTYGYCWSWKEKQAAARAAWMASLRKSAKRKSK